MPLVIPTVADPRDPASPIRNAHARITFFALDLLGHAGSIEFGVYASAAAADAGAQPITRVAVALGQKFGEHHFPTADELLADADLGASYARIVARFEALAAATVPALEGATTA
jgi:hypothetical protein